MMKIAYNRCFGGFRLSHAAIMRYAELKGIKVYPFVYRRLADNAPLPDRSYRPATQEELNGRRFMLVHYCTTPEFSEESYWSDYDAYKDREDPTLIQVIEELGEKANGTCAKLAIEDVPAGTLWRIDEYDGRETVATQDSYDWKVAS